MKNELMTIADIKAGNTDNDLQVSATPLRKPLRFKPAGRLLTLLLLTGFVSACSQVPEALDPTEWYNNAVNAFKDDKPETTDQTATAEGENALAKDRGKPAPGADDKFPNLSDVDAQQKASEQLANGLIADTSGRKRAPAVARQGEAVNPLVQPTDVASQPETAPAPPAVPVTPVVTAEAAPEPSVKEPVEKTETATDKAQSAAPVTPEKPLVELPKPSSSLSIATTAEQKQFEQRMARRLAEIRARANQPAPELARLSPSAPAPAPALSSALSSAPALSSITTPQPSTFPGNSFQLPTVVVSSSGVETGYASALAPTIPVVGTSGLSVPKNATSGIFNQAALPVPGRSTKVATILFGNGSARLTASDRRILAQVSQLAKERGAKIRIVGHASSRTKNVNPVRHKMINFKVSVERANAVARALSRFGIKADSMFVSAVSDQNPEFYEYMPTGEAGNRRAEIYLDS